MNCSVNRSTRSPGIFSGSPVRPLVSSIVMLATSVGPVTAWAVDRYVDPAAGVDALSCDDPLAPCQSIAYTIAQSVAADTVNLVSLAGVATTYYESGLVIPFDLTIRGQGPFQTEIDAQGLDRIFTINGNSAVIRGVTLRNGDAQFAAGGAIRVESGDLLVTAARLLDNTALTGGAIAALPNAGSVTVSASVISDNLATSSGGGIFCDECDRVTVALSRIVDNVAGGLGGGLYAFSTTATAWASRLARNSADGGGAIYGNFANINVLDSELNDNVADSTDGGAINHGGLLNIERSTLAGNSAAGGGGAVHMGSGGILASANSTYSGNEATFGGALSLSVAAGPGPDVLIGTSTFYDNLSSFPGVAEQFFGGWTSFELYNSIVANDLSAGAVLEPYCSGALSGGSNNLIDDASCDTGVAGFNLGAVTGLDTVLAYHGGITRTHLIDASSNAVDEGRNVACLNPATGAALVIDQRGLARPVDFDSSGAAECDIGAVELQ